MMFILRRLNVSLSLSLYLEASRGGPIRERTKQLASASKESESRDRNLKTPEEISLPNPQA
jgi:hypothetical protein